MMHLLAQAEPAAAAAKAAADLLNAQDLLAMWKGIATVCAAGAVGAATMWYRCVMADIARLNKIVEVYQTQTQQPGGQKAAA